MIHNDNHELVQDAAMRLIAGAVSSIAGHLGLVPAAKDAQRAIQMLDTDMMESPEEPAAPTPDTTKAELHATPPVAELEPEPKAERHDEHRTHTKSSHPHGHHK